MSDKPHAPERRQKLVRPFFSGSGKDFETVYMFHEGPELAHGMVLSTDKNDLIIVREASSIEEDFFENITITACQLITKDPLQRINHQARELYYMYSASSEK
jgi:hypothetical protein